jgi:hypothetical protein
MSDSVLKMMIDMLKRLEWSYDGGLCPLCVNGRKDKHDPECKLGMVISSMRKGTRKKRVKNESLCKS